MKLNNLLGLKSSDRYLTQTIAMTDDVSVSMNDSYLLVVQPDQSDRTLTINQDKVGSFIIIQNDSEFSLNIINEVSDDGYSYTLPSNDVIKLYMLRFGEFIAIDDGVPDEVVIIPPEPQELYKFIASDYVDGDLFGRSVSISGYGSNVLVGSPSKSTTATKNGGVYAFGYDNNTWTEDFFIFANDATDYAFFGCSVTMNSSGTMCAIGAYGDNNTTGAVYIFTRGPVDTSWTQQQKLTASDGGSSQGFGVDVAMNPNGDVLVIGAHAALGIDPITGLSSGQTSGAIYVFEWDGSSWIEEQKLSSDLGLNGDYFGRSVSIDQSGSKIAAGSKYENGSTGAVYVYTNYGSWALEDRVTSFGSIAGDLFGTDISLSPDGNSMFIGAIGRDSNEGTTYVFKYSTSWSEDSRFSGDSPWPSERHGSSVSMTHGVAIVGVNSNGDFGTTAGTTYVYAQTEILPGFNVWSFDSKMYAITPESGENFGYSVHINTTGDRCVIGGIGSIHIVHNIVQTL